MLPALFALLKFTAKDTATIGERRKQSNGPLRRAALATMRGIRPTRFGPT